MSTTRQNQEAGRGAQDERATLPSPRPQVSSRDAAVKREAEARENAALDNDSAPLDIGSGGDAIAAEQGDDALDALTAKAEDKTPRRWRVRGTKRSKTEHDRLSHQDLARDQRLTKEEAKRWCAGCGTTEKKDFSFFYGRDRTEPLCDRCDQLERYKEREAKLCAATRANYGRYKKKLEENGSTIEREMTTPSHLLYLVTSIACEGDQFSPHLHGIYTTCRKAKEGADKVFSSLAKTYLYGGGGFVQSNSGAIAKLDVMDFLTPGIPFTSRVLFEVMADKENDCPVYAAVAITSVSIDRNVVRHLPFMGLEPAHHRTGEPETTENARPSSIDSASKVYAIFSYSPGEGATVPVMLRGVYTKRDAAMQRAEKIAEELMAKFAYPWSESRCSAQAKQTECTRKLANGSLFCALDEERYWEVAMEVVSVDEVHGGDAGSELGVNCGGDSKTWWPSIDIDWYDEYDEWLMTR